MRTVTGVGRTIGAAVTGNRPLEGFEVKPIMAIAVLLAVVAVIGVMAPRVLAWPLALVAGWTAVTFIAEAWYVWRHRDR